MKARYAPAAAVLVGLWCLAAFGHASEPQAATARPRAVPTVNLNKATEAELVKLPGIGPSRAQAIIAQRKRRPFRRPEEILRVRGIGRKTFQRLRPYLRVKDPPKPRGG